MSTQATILALAQTLCYSLGDSTEMQRIYYEVAAALGQDPRGFFSTITTDVAGGTVADATDNAHVELPTATTAPIVTKLLAFFYEGRELLPETEQALDAVNPSWRDVIGQPQFYVTEDEDDRILRLHPKPAAAATTPVIIIHTSVELPSIADSYDLPVALLIVAREFERESPHRDKDFAGVARALGEYYLGFIA